MANPEEDLARTLISAEEIDLRVKAIADQVSADYRDSESLYLIGILKGAFIFLSDLTRKLSVPHVVDFMALSSYGKSVQATEAVRILMDLREPIEGKEVMIVEDIVDSGQTLNYLYHLLEARQPKSLKTCVLLQKKRNGLQVPLHYLGFEIPDVWVVGYGLDYADHYRTLPYIAELKQSVYS